MYIMIQAITGLESYINVTNPYKNKDMQIAYHPVKVEILNSNYKVAEIIAACYSNAIFNKMYFLVSKKQYNWYTFLYLF